MKNTLIILSLLSFIFSQGYECENQDNVGFNVDGIVDVLDIVQIVNYILSN